MKTMARRWEKRFDELMKESRTGQYRERVEWFVFKLHLAVQAVETQSDGSKLLIFRDGSVYGEESDLAALLALGPRQNCERKQTQPELVGGRNAEKPCRKGNRDAGRVQSRA